VTCGLPAPERARLLVNFYFAHPVGHVIEALRYALGYHRAAPDLRISLALNASAPTELASLVPYVERVHAIGGGFDFVRGGDARQAIAHIPRDWDYLVDDARRDHLGLRALFPGMAAYYDAADRYFRVARARGVAGAEPPAYLPHQRVVLDLPEASRATSTAPSAPPQHRPEHALALGNRRTQPQPRHLDLLCQLYQTRPDRLGNGHDYTPTPASRTAPCPPGLVASEPAQPHSHQESRNSRAGHGKTKGEKWLLMGEAAQETARELRTTRGMASRRKTRPRAGQEGHRLHWHDRRTG
jgi:hypothetical protein